jgi:flagellar basal body-associated protein FliL
MKALKLPKEKIPRIIYIVLLSITALLALLLLAGTVIGLAHSRTAAQPVFSFSRSAGTSRSVAQSDDIRIFSGLGRLRIPLSNSSILLLSLAFPYHASDTAFTEELAAKIGDFRTIATSYFSALPEEGIIQIDEDAAKGEILRRFNENLRLGYIEALYFSDMMLIDAGL